MSALKDMVARSFVFTVMSLRLRSLSMLESGIKIMSMKSMLLMSRSRHHLTNEIADCTVCIVPEGVKL